MLQIWNVLKLYQQKTENFERGIQDCEKALSLAPGRMEAGDLEYLTHHQAGTLHQAMGNAAEADKAFSQAVALRPIYFPAVESLIPIKRGMTPTLQPWGANT